jgi:hypothetical protein
LVIEVDGGQHNMTPGIVVDAARDRHLRSNNFKVLRFWNSDLMRNIEGVGEVIREALELDTPTPPRKGEGSSALATLSPRGEREKRAHRGNGNVGGGGASL